jgi:hypothetical protein
MQPLQFYVNDLKGWSYSSEGKTAMNRLLLAVVLLMLPSIAISQDDRDEPLLRMLQQIPAGAQGEISLSDIAAASRQITPLTHSVPDHTRAIVPYTSLFHGLSGFDMGSFAAFVEDGARDALGFSIFEISQIGGWGELPAAPVIIAGIAHRSGNIEAALLTRNFEIAEYNGHKVWHRGRDYETGSEPPEEEPFSIRLNSSQRFAIKNEFLLFARGWPVLHGILDAQTSLATDHDATAIVRAGYRSNDAGDLIDIVLLLGQPEAAPSATVTLPPFTRYGLLRWQNGATMTGAIVIPYAETETAVIARNRFTMRLDTLQAQSVERPFSDILPWARHNQIVEVSDRAVLILGFEYQADMSQPVNLLTFMRNPGHRLVEMLRNGDLDMLIGHAE